MTIKKVAVVGAGTMGCSIAVALISKGITVVLKDANQEALLSGLACIDQLLASLIKKGVGQDEANNWRKLVHQAEDYSQLADVDLVIEAVVENINIKKEVFEQLDKYCRPEAILVSNTSCLSITQLAAFTGRPDKVLGMHFFNPAHLMKLIEVIPGLDTAPDTVQKVIKFGQMLDKLTVRVEECASFLVNRLLARYMNEALWCLQEGKLTIEEIDKAACDYAMPIGPLALRDMNGADVGLSVANFNFQEYGERFRPAPILEKMVNSQLLGRKTGSGFYLYDPETKKRISGNPAISKLISEIKADTSSAMHAPFKPEQLFLPMINEAFLALQEKICFVDELDPALMAALGMRCGPLVLASQIGLKHCLQEIEYYFKLYGERFRPAPLLKRFVWAGRDRVV